MQMKTMNNIEIFFKFLACFCFFCYSVNNSTNNLWNIFISKNLKKKEIFSFIINLVVDFIFINFLIIYFFMRL